MKPFDHTRVAASAAAVTATLALATSAIGGGCPGDSTGDGVVDTEDLVNLLAAWGPCPGCAEDHTGDDVVDTADLLVVLAGWGPCPDGGATDQLAGNSLDAYPYFEFVRSFNEGATVEIAIDPANVPGPGATADVYIVAAKTESEWAGDPSLTDVRGSAQTETFAGSTIQENTFLLTGSTGLSGDAGIGLGVGYDLVCDFNQNGTLDEGDLIDGLSDRAGFYVVRDPTTGGPLATSETQYSVTGVTPNFTQQKVYYPSDIATRGRVPLVTMSHGNGHQYVWYDYLGRHFASYGYVFMSHQNNTGPGIETASQTTWEHTDAFLGQLDTIAGGVLEGHIDDSRIAWLGHSRGGEGVARAYTRVHDELVVPANYTSDDIIFVSSIAPNNSLGAGSTEPRKVNYHLIWGSADGDISGSGSSSGTWSFAIYERAQGFRQSTYVQGADHNDFNCCGFNDFTGPAGTEIGRAEAQQVAKAVYLTLISRYIEQNPAALDLIWRQWENFHPDGVMDETIVVSEYKEGIDEPRLVIDDYQTEFDTGTSSSGGAVTSSVQNLVEDNLADLANGYAWLGTEPMNGMSRSGSGSRGAVFDWSSGTQLFMEYEVIAGERDFSDDTYLSFRACQGTQHPETTAELADLTFSVTLRDGGGTSSTIDFAAYGGGIEEVYQRSGGWQNEFETVRIRITDFTHNGSGLDLADVVAVRFDFGSSSGSAQGRLGIDDVELSNNADPPMPGAIRMSLPDRLPVLIPPDEPAVLTVKIVAAGEDIVEDSPTLHYRFADGGFSTTPLVPVGGDLYEGTLPAPSCGTTPEFYFSAAGSETGEITLPAGAPEDFYSTEVGVANVLFSDDFESDLGWTVENEALTDGAWERGVPAGGGGRGDPPSDFDGSGNCYVTDNVAGNSDVDGGPTRLISPVIDVSSMPEARVGYAKWFFNDDADIDNMLVEVSADGGATWEEMPIEDTLFTTMGWELVAYRIADVVTPNDQMRFRFSVTDNPNDSVTEAGLDAVMIFTVECD
jgi:hypothetical protein